MIAHHAKACESGKPEYQVEETKHPLYSKKPFRGELSKMQTCASSCMPATVVYYFSKYYTVRFQMFSIFYVVFV